MLDEDECEGKVFEEYSPNHKFRRRRDQSWKSQWLIDDGQKSPIDIVEESRAEFRLVLIIPNSGGLNLFFGLGLDQKR